jgi:hypothetical protein
LFTEFLVWVQATRTWLEGPGAPLANFFQIASTAILVGGAVYGLFRRRLRHSGAVISRLQEDLARRTEQLDRSLQQEKQLEASCTEVTERLNEIALAKLNREIRDGNASAAHRIVRDWLEREGASISALLRSEAEWATIHAVGDAHLAGLVVAEAFASAAHTTWPEAMDTAELAAELRKVSNSSRIERLPSFRKAEATLADIAPNRFLAGELVDYALALEREARNLEAGGFFRLALAQTETVVVLLRRELGDAARPSLRARTTRVRLLLWVGRAHDALADIRQITTVLTQAVGPEHPDTLDGRGLLVRVLDVLGRETEALSIIEDVVAKQSASPKLGPDHPDTLKSRHLLAQVLRRRGRSAEALPIIEDVVAKQASPELGPQHPDTLVSRLLMAEVLMNLGRPAEALPIIEDVVAKQASPELGPHPNTFVSRALMVEVLRNLGRPAEALPIIEDVVAKQSASPELGPQHPSTLMSRSFMAHVLMNLGRPAEALPIFEDVATKRSASPELGPQHPNTLSSRMILAHVLNNLGHSAEALPIIEDVVAKQSASPELGPQHPDTLASRSVLANVIDTVHATQNRSPRTAEAERGSSSGI